MINNDKQVRHLAIIMDGNGRWAQSKGKTRSYGHTKGAENVLEIVKFCKQKHIEYLTLYAFSTENWLRPAAEVSFLMKLMTRFIDNKLAEMVENNIKFNVIGDLTRLKKNVRDKIIYAQDKTSHSNSITLTLAINYGGRDEIIRAMRKVAYEIQENKISLQSINEDFFAKYLDTTILPDPDLVIRTAGEMRWSNFLIWQAAYSELYVTKKCWPDFDHGDLEEALSNFCQRNRKFGKVI